MNTARILELLDEREYPITGDSPLARYALELRDAIAALRADLAYYQAKWENELSTVSKLERERDALREEVSRLTENQRQQDSATAFVMERDEKERDALRREVEEYKSEYFRVHNLKMDAIEARLAAERELAACKENAERYRWLRDCDTEDIPTMGGELMAREALDEHIDAAIKAARKV